MSYKYSTWKCKFVSLLNRTSFLFIKNLNLQFNFFVQVEIKYSDGSLERYSETVLFFHLPGYPHPDASSMTEGEIKASVQVTNDGRHFSNELTFIYLPQSKMTVTQS